MEQGQVVFLTTAIPHSNQVLILMRYQLVLFSVVGVVVMLNIMV